MALSKRVTSVKETFGEKLRRGRQAKKITLRKFASLINVSPTYISQIENNIASYPTEEVICKISRILEENEDEFLALANKIHSDLVRIINRFPREISTFLRIAQGFDQSRWRYLIQQIEQEKNNEREKFSPLVTPQSIKNFTDVVIEIEK